MFKIVLLSKNGNIYEFNSKEEIDVKPTKEEKYYYSCEINDVDIDEVVYLTNIVAIIQYNPSKLNGTKKLTISVNNGQDSIVINKLSITDISMNDKNKKLYIRTDDFSMKYYNGHFDMLELEETNIEKQKTKKQDSSDLFNYDIVSLFGKRHNILDVVSFEKEETTISNDNCYSITIQKINSKLIFFGIIGYVAINKSRLTQKKGNYVLNLNLAGEEIKIKNINRVDVKLYIKPDGELDVNCKGYKIKYYFKHCNSAFLSDMSLDMSSNIKKIINKNSKSMVLSL
jgi:hypothetical protein